MEQDERDKAMGVGCGGSPTPCAAAVPGAAQPGPGAAIYLPWLVPRAGGRAVTRQLLNEGRRMTPGGSGCGRGGDNGSRARHQMASPGSPSPLLRPQLLFLGKTPPRQHPLGLGRCDRLTFTVPRGDGDPRGGGVDTG